MNHREDPAKKPLIDLHDGFIQLALVILIALAIGLAVESGWVSAVMNAISGQRG